MQSPRPLISVSVPIRNTTIATCHGSCIRDAGAGHVPRGEWTSGVIAHDERPCVRVDGLIGVRGQRERRELVIDRDGHGHPS